MHNHSRKPNRLPSKIIYEKNNWYFVTICTHKKVCILSEVVGANPYSPVKLLPLGDIINQEWNNLSKQFGNIYLDEFVIMPNHFHAIIGFDGTPYSLYTNKHTDLSKIIKRFKQETVRKFKEYIENYKSDKNPLGEDHKGVYGNAPTNNLNQIWQKSFYDHVIRDEKDLNNIREYIINNPLKWHLDSLNPKFKHN